MTYPIALTVLLCPVYRAEAELALSVMKLSIEWVWVEVVSIMGVLYPLEGVKNITIWWPRTGNLSSCRVLWYLPLMLE